MSMCAEKVITFTINPQIHAVQKTYIVLNIHVTAESETEPVSILAVPVVIGDTDERPVCVPLNSYSEKNSL